MSTTTSLPEPLERAIGRLERTASTAQACFDDLGAPDWQSFRRSRSRFLDRTTPSESAEPKAALPTGRRDGG